MNWAEWVRAVHAIALDERQLQEIAASVARAGAIARRAALDLPFGASPVDFAGEFARLARDGRKP